jgi:hypothetical protein
MSPVSSPSRPAAQVLSPQVFAKEHSMNHFRPFPRRFVSLAAACLLGGLGCVGQINNPDTEGGKEGRPRTASDNPEYLPPAAPAPTPIYVASLPGAGVQTGTAAATTAVATDGGAGAPACPPTAPVLVAGPPDAAPAVPTPPSPPVPAADGGVAVPTPACATAAEIAAKILTPKCGGCHGKASPAAGLDLVTAGVKARLLNIPARGCAGKPLIVATPTVGGHFFDKLAGAVTACGNQMPFGAPPLSPVEIKCLMDWIAPTP